MDVNRILISNEYDVKDIKNQNKYQLKIFQKQGDVKDFKIIRYDEKKKELNTDNLQHMPDLLYAAFVQKHLSIVTVVAF